MDKLPKYVRTHDDIYKVLWMDDENSYGCEDKTVPYGVEQIFTYQIIAKADEILDLCDYYIVHRKTDDKRFIYNAHKKLSIYDIDISEEEAHDCDAYGAIWVNGNLICVAKNVKGELVLMHGKEKK